MKRTLMRLVGMLAGVLVVLALWACGDSDPASTATPQQTTLIFSDLNWNTALLQNAVARTILEKGYGYETASVPGTTIPLMEALIAGETNVTMEFWLPSVLAIWHEAKAAGTIVQIGYSLASPGWDSAFLIPQYTADANPGLRSVEDLKLEEHWSLFVRPDSNGKAGLVTCVSGWECEADQREAGVRLRPARGHQTHYPEHLPRVEHGHPFCVRQARADPVLLLGPRGDSDETKRAIRRLLYRLEEPDYSDECWDHLAAASQAQDVTQACAYP